MKKNDGHIYLKDQWHDALYYIFSLDSPLWRTFKGLMTNPGKVGREYIAGKRKSYYTPIKYFILATAVYFLLVKLTGFNPVKLQYEAFGAPPREDPISDMIRNNVNYFLFLFVIILSFISKLFFHKQEGSFPERIAYSFFVIGHYIFLNIIFVPLCFIHPSFILVKYSTLIYLIWGIYSFHNGNVIWRLIKSFLTVFLGYLLYIGTVYALSVLIYKISH
jgi:hypothetical protein